MAQTDILEYIRKTPYNSNVNVIKGMLNSSGSGDSSDLNTAEVTITNALADVFKIVLLPVIIENEQMTGVAGVYPLLLDTQDSITLTVPLYKGQCLWFTSYEEYADYTFAGTGSVDVNPLGIVITGDCTITIS